MTVLQCPDCLSIHIKRNGHTYYGKQNHRCKECGRHFVAESQQISSAIRSLVEKLSLERLSLRGICRVVGVSLTWLLYFIATFYPSLPDDLNVLLPTAKTNVQLFCLDVEADELWSFVGRKTNPQWVWLAMDTGSRQIIAFYPIFRYPCGGVYLSRHRDSENAHFCGTSSMFPGCAPIHRKVFCRSGERHGQRYDRGMSESAHFQARNWYSQTLLGG